MDDRTHSDPAWYVIHTNPRQEDRTAGNLKAWNVETFSPQIRAWRYNQFTGERIDMIKPLFPRYLFAKFDLEHFYHKVRYTRGVNSVVTFTDHPARVDDDIIALIKSRIVSDGFVKVGSDLKPGDRVVIKDGPLKNLSGIFESEMSDSDRVVVLLNTLSYQARVHVDRDLLRVAAAGNA